MILTPQQTLIQQLARQFAQQELTKAVLDEVEETGVFPEAILQKMAQAGFFGIKVPRELGGAGLDNLSYMLVMEEIAKVSAVASIYVATPNSLSSGPLFISGTKAQIEKYLVPIAKGEKKVCFALTEPGAGSDPVSLSTSAVREGDYYLLNGRKTFITMAPLADTAVVYAKTDASKGAKGITAFLVDMKAPGVTCGKPENKMGLIGCATSDIILENVKVPVADRLGAEGMGFINAMKTLDVGRLGVAAQAIGVAAGCLELSINYAKERQQFGKRIGDFQAIRFLLAQMATKLEAARQLVYHAASLKDANDKQAGPTASMAKLYAAEVCNEIAGQAVQIHGGYGFIKDYAVERMYRDCRVFTIYEGTSQVQQIVIGNALMK